MFMVPKKGGGAETCNEPQIPEPFREIRAFQDGGLTLELGGITFLLLVYDIANLERYSVFHGI